MATRERKERRRRVVVAARSVVVSPSAEGRANLGDEHITESALETFPVFVL